MDWSNERYVRLYTRDTGDTLAVGWDGRAVFHELLRRCDRVGVIDETDPAVLAELLRMPADIVAVGIEKLIGRGVIQVGDGLILIPNFLEAQEASSSDRQRQHESRQRRKEMASRAVTKRDNSSQDVTRESQNVTDCHDSSRVVTDGHKSSQVVTPSLAVPSLAKPTPAPRCAFDLESAYQAYPRKVGKRPGLTKAARLIRTREDFLTFLSACQRMGEEWSGQDQTYCPHFSTFVSQERWRDDELPLPGRDRAATGPKPPMLRLG